MPKSTLHIPSVIIESIKNIERIESVNIKAIIFEDSLNNEYVLERDICFKSIIIDDDKIENAYGALPRRWFLPVNEPDKWDLNQIDNDPKKLLLIGLKRKTTNMRRFIYKFEKETYTLDETKYAITNSEGIFEVESAEVINAKVEQLKYNDYEVEFMSQETDVAQYLIPLIVYTETKNSFGQGEVYGSNANNVQIKRATKEIFDKYCFESKAKNLLLNAVAKDYQINFEKYVNDLNVPIIVEFEKVSKSESKKETKNTTVQDNVAKKLEQLSTMNKDAVPEEAIEETVEVTHHFEGSFINADTKHYERLLESHKGAYADQKIPFKGINIHHSLSVKNINQGLCKAPDNISFVKFRCQGFKGARFKTQDFEFSLEGLVSALYYRDQQLAGLGTKFARSHKILNKHIFDLIYLIGAERFCKLYNIAPNLEFMKIAQGVTKRFFGKELKLTQLRTNRVKNIYQGLTSITDASKNKLLNDVPENFKIFIKTSLYDDKFEGQETLEIRDNLNMKNIEELNLDTKCLGHSVCLYNGKPIYHSSNSKELKVMTNVIINYLNKLDDYICAVRSNNYVGE